MGKNLILLNLRTKSGIFFKGILAALLFLITLGHTSVLNGQERITVSGTITGVSGPLAGVSVNVKNSNISTSTDAQGNYSVAVRSANDVLVFSFVGYESEERAVGNQRTINVVLQEDEQSLEEVVVVGYGVQKKSVITGSISSVKASDLENMPSGRVEQSLQGRTSGVTILQSTGQPGAASTIQIRGMTSFNNNDPLWVVDGVVVSSDAMGYLNQSDIESIEVLKDAASQAIYGARAAAGVILVTTKRGRAGQMRIHYNGYVGTQAPAKRLDLLSAADYVMLRNESLTNAGRPATFTNPGNAGTDWQDVIFNNSALKHNHEFSINGGNETSTFYASFGHIGQDGIVATDISGYKRTSFRLNSEHKIAKWLKLGQNLGYSNDKTQAFYEVNSEFGGPLSSAINLDPLTPIIETDPTRLANPPYSNLSVARDADGNPYGVSPYNVREASNPYAFMQTQRGNHNWSDNIIGNAYAEITPVEGLTIRSTLGSRLAFWGYTGFKPVIALSTEFIETQNQYRRELNRGIDWNFENTVSYTRSFDAHNLTGLIGQGAYVDNSRRGTVVVYNGIPVSTYEQASMNYNIPTDSRDGTGYEVVPHKVTSLFARMNYNYAEKYLVEALIRRDGSSRFGSNNRYGYFPSFSLGWVVSKESFLENNAYISSLKLRGSYGVVGNDNIGDFAYLATVSGGRNYAFGNTGGYLIGYSPDAPSNPDLRWEQTSQTNVGMDLTLLRNFNISFDWYNKHTKDILQYPRIPDYMGANANSAANVADMKNSGVELELGYNTNIGQVQFSASGNVSHHKNEVTYLGRGIEYLSGGITFQNSTYPLTRTALGQPYGAFFGFQTDGIFQNQAEVNSYVNSQGVIIQPNAVPGDFRWADTNDDGRIDESDRVFIGNPIPTWAYGMSLSAAWKGVDLSVFGQGAGGNKIFQALRRLDAADANYQRNALGRWTGEGSTNSHPRLTDDDRNNNFGNPSDFYLQDGSYFRIRVLQLGYRIPQAMANKVGLQNLRIYAMAENLFTFTSYTGYDPEIGRGNPDIGNGGSLSIDRGVYPQARAFMLGINIGF